MFPNRALQRTSTSAFVKIGRVVHKEVLEVVDAEINGQIGSRIGLVTIRSTQLITRVTLHLALGESFEVDPEKRVVAGAGDE